MTTSGVRVFIAARSDGTPHAHHVGQRAHACQYAAQFFEPVYTDAQHDVRRTFTCIRHGGHVLDADLFVSEYGTHVPHQSPPVEGIDRDVDRKQLVTFFSPGDLDYALRLLGLQTQQAGAGIAMNANAAAEGDVARDRFRRYGSAAASDMRQQVANLLDGDT